MRLPYVKNISSPAKKYTVRFCGINKSNIFEDGELEDLENLSMTNFPYLTVRKPYNWGFISTESGKKLNKIWGDGSLFAAVEVDEINSPYISKIKVRNYNENAVDIPDLEAIGGFDELGLKNVDFVRINNKLTVFTDDSSGLNSSNLLAPYTINLDPDLVDRDPELTEYAWESTTCIMWGSATTLPNRLILHEPQVLGGRGGIPNFLEGDTVAVYWAQGTDGDGNIIWGNSPDLYGVLSSRSTSIINGITEFGFTTDLFGTSSAPQDSRAKVEKVTPDGLCFPMGINNRIWAVKGNSIFASALGEPSRWESFEGLASDSYQVSVDSSGNFTGVSVFDNNPVFFKENTVYRLYGTIPSNFSLQKIDAPGVMQGCSKSIQKINEVLYYKGKSGVYRYSGGIPECISEKLGDLSDYGKAVAGADERYYYLAMSKKGEDFADKKPLYIYDTKTGVWLKDSADTFTSFALWGNVLYMKYSSSYVASRELDSEKGLTVSGEYGNVNWYAEFKPFTETVKEKKVYSRLYFRLELDEGSYVTVFVKYDNEPFKEVKTVKSDFEKGVVTVPVILKKCDSFAVRFEGRNGCTVKTLLREYRTAGDR